MSNYFFIISLAILLGTIIYSVIDLLTIRENSRKKLLSLIITLAITIVILFVFRISSVSFVYGSLASQISYANIGILASIALISTLLPFYYVRRSKRFIALFVALALISIFSLYNGLSYSIIGFIGVGSVVGLSCLKQPNKRKKNNIETNRDIFQIVLGVAFTIIFLLFRSHSIEIVAVVLLGGYVANSVIGARKKGRIYNFLSTFEREEVLFGLGALYLIAGTWLLIGFIGNYNVMIFGIIALFIADPVATLTGIRSKTKLPYNKKKSIVGTLSYFLVVGIIGFFFLGFYALIIGAALAIIESLDLEIDDNVSVAIALIILYYIAFIFLKL